MSHGEENQVALRRFRDVLRSSPARAAYLLSDVHPADAAAWLWDVEPDTAREIFARIPTEQQAAVLEQAGESLTQVLAQALPPDALAEVVEELHSDEAVDVLAEVEDHVAEHVLGSLEDEEAEELRSLRAHDPESAGGVMTTDFVTVPVDGAILDAVKSVKQEAEEDEEGLGVFVVDAEGRPVGYLSEHQLLSQRVHDPVTAAMSEPYLVAVDEDQEVAASMLHRYDLQAVGVVDAEGKLVGAVSEEDARDILAEEFTEDVHRLVGTGSEQQTRLPVLRRVRQRLPLMGVTVAGGLASAKLLDAVAPAHPGSGEFEAILRYLPLIVGLAGNVGVQCSTILVRAFATQEVEPDRELAVLGGEVAVGTILGLLCGGLTIAVAGAIEGSWALGASVGTAILAAVTWAAVLGCMVPMGCRRLSVDPAIVAGPFLITLSDLSGVAIYIVVASLLIGSS